MNEEIADFQLPIADFENASRPADQGELAIGNRQLEIT